MSINHIWTKIKSGVSLLDRRDIFAVCLIVLTGTSCFFFGMMYEKDQNKPQITITNDLTAATGLSEVKTISPTKTTTEPSNTTYPGLYVASKNSNKFHLPWCSGAKQISEANKIWFKTKEEALAKGFIPASNCKGI